MKPSYQRALIIGGSRGAGKELALSLSAQGTNTTVVARQEDALAKLKTDAPDINTMAMDATGDGVAEKLMKEIDPDLLILTVGYEPKMIPFHEQSWDEFSGAWNTDTRIAHAFSSAALTQPMKKGGVVVSFSSGAGLSGSRLSGGYAGAKRMQHFLTDYAQREAEARARVRVRTRARIGVRVRVQGQWSVGRCEGCEACSPGHAGPERAPRSPPPPRPPRCVAPQRRPRGGGGRAGRRPGRPAGAEAWG